MFATGSLARRIEAAESSMIAQAAAFAARRRPEGRGFAMSIRGGVAAYADPVSPLNKVAGLGFDRVPDEEELRAVEAAYEERRSPVTVELSSFADPSVGRLLTRRGYELIGYENVSGLALDRGGADLPPGRAAELPPEGGSNEVSIVRVSDDEAEDWLDVVISGFLHPDVFDGLASHESYDSDVARRSVEDMAAVDCFERYLARRGGVAAGGASFRAHDGVALLCGSATRPEHRRRGIQTTLLRHRLAEAARRGCDLAAVTTQPGSKSQQNVERFGFSLLYVRAVLVRPPPVGPAYDP
jgi:GNAT superfamily N-acetyltransferase